MSKTHKILMLACCLIGLGAAAAIWLFKIPGKSVFITLLLLLCPLSHLLMMKFMGHDHESHVHDKHQVIDIPKEAGQNVANQ